jgi:hypothetical protein
MKRFAFSNLLALALAQMTSAQATSPAAPAGSLDNYVYAVPRGWTRANYPDGIVYGSPMFNNGERCQISIFQMRPASASLPAVADETIEETAYDPQTHSCAVRGRRRGRSVDR